MVDNLYDRGKTASVRSVVEEHHSANLHQTPLRSFDVDFCHDDCLGTTNQ